MKMLLGYAGLTLLTAGCSPGEPQATQSHNQQLAAVFDGLLESITFGRDVEYSTEVADLRFSVIRVARGTLGSKAISVCVQYYGDRSTLAHLQLGRSYRVRLRMLVHGMMELVGDPDRKFFVPPSGMADPEDILPLPAPSTDLR